MSTSGLSLLGFMNAQQAANYLQNACIHPAAPAALQATWTAANANLGPPTASAGTPATRPSPAVHAGYVASLVAQQWAAAALAGPLAGSSFEWLEIAPLLAYQHHVDDARSQHHCQGLSNPPTDAELLSLCLPMAIATDDVHVSQHMKVECGAVALKSRSLNFVLAEVKMDQGVLSMRFSWAIPIVQVVRFNGRHYLHNGYHRVVGAARKGATHVPCAVRAVGTAQDAGILGQGRTFELPLLESANPPTLGHFVTGHAHAVTLRGQMRVLHVTWTDHVMAEE